MVKVDLIYPYYISEPNGAARLLTKLKESSNLFYDQGVELRIISPDLFKRDSSVNNTSERYVWLKSVVRWFSRHSLLMAFFRYYRLYHYPAKKILRYYDSIKDKGTFVNFHDTTTCYEYIRNYSKLGQKVVLTIHGDGDFWSMIFLIMPKLKSKVFNLYRRRFEKCILTGCDKIGFDADLPRKYFSSKYSFEEDKSFFVYNGIEYRPFPIRETSDRLKLICLATLNERKNQISVLEAIETLPRDYQDKVEIVLVGDGPSRKELENKASLLSASCTFVGSAEESEYYKYFLESNCFILFSKSEGLPISIIEAMRAGLPIIGSNVAGIPEQIIDSKTGYILPLSISLLAEKLKYIIDNIGDLSRMGKESYDLYIRKFTVESMVEQYANVFYKI